MGSTKKSARSQAELSDPRETDRMWTVNDVARYFVVENQTIRKACHRGELPFFRLGKLLRFSREAVYAWVRKRELETRSR